MVLWILRIMSANRLDFSSHELDALDLERDAPNSCFGKEIACLLG